MIYHVNGANGAVLQRMEPWCSGLTCLPVTQKTAGSNPVGSVLKTLDVASWFSSSHFIFARFH